MPKLFIAIMWVSREDYDKAVSVLKEKYGNVKKESEEYDFDKYTDYYEPEMGKNIKKKFLVFEKEIEKKDLAQIKKETTDIEQEFVFGEDKRKYTDILIEGKRKINLDPGFIDEHELVLASFKQKGFKEELGKGVFAHKVLEFKDGKAISFFHTFRDYIEYKNFFL